MIYVVKSKITKSGQIVNLCGDSKHRDYFAGSKLYWIEYGRPSGNDAIKSSNNLKYISKKFDEII